MNESTLRDFFLNKTQASVLASEIDHSLKQEDQVTTTVQIHKMEGDFEITREMLANLCAAVLDNELHPQHLTAIAFALLASDCFKWRDEVLGEIIYDWAAPEINYQLTTQNLELFREILLGQRPYPTRPRTANPVGQVLISRMKTEFK